MERKNRPIQAPTDHLLSAAGTGCSNVGSESYRIPRLHKHGTGSCEFANQALAGRHPGQYAARRYAFEFVFAVPSDQVAVIDNVFFAGSKLICFVSQKKFTARVSIGG